MGLRVHPKPLSAKMPGSGGVSTCGSGWCMKATPGWGSQSLISEAGVETCPLEGVGIEALEQIHRLESQVMPGWVLGEAQSEKGWNKQERETIQRGSGWSLHPQLWSSSVEGGWGNREIGREGTKGRHKQDPSA